MSLWLHQHIFRGICAELEYREDFGTLYKCALSFKDLSYEALECLYRSVSLSDSTKGA